MALLLDVPERPYHIVQPRVWNKINKDAMRKALEFHHTEHMPRHFKKDARSRYHYMPRKLGYMKAKQRRFKSERVDLVYSGRTRDQILKPNGWDSLRVGGTAVGGNLKGTLTYRFSFADQIRAHHLAKSVRFHNDPLANRNKQQKAARKFKQRRLIDEDRKARVTIDQMRKELSAMTKDEQEAVAEKYRAEVFRAIAALPQKRRRLKAGGTERSFLKLVGS